MTPDEPTKEEIAHLQIAMLCEAERAAMLRVRLMATSLNTALEQRAQAAMTREISTLLENTKHGQ